MQTAYKLDKVTLCKIGKGALIAMGGVLCTYLLEVIPGIDFGSLTPAIVGISSIVINAIREWIKGQKV
jgi:hypothetical protein